jgi:hypothetical protein
MLGRLCFVVVVASLNAAPLVPFRQAATNTAPVRTLLVRTADSSSAASDLVASAASLTEALRTRGFSIARSFEEADAVVEILGRRQVRMRLGVNSTAAAPVELIRTQIMLGEETEEIRGYSGFAHQFSVSAQMDAADGIERWLKGRRMSPLRAPAQNVDAVVPPVLLGVMLTRTAQYVTSFQQQFASVIGEERYRQQFTVERAVDSETLAVRLVKTSRSLRSELSFAWFSDVPGWFGFRDVIDVDGKPVKDRDRRLAALFFEKPTGKLLKRALQESARYNLGTIRRNFNVPMVALQFLGADVASRFRFEELGPEHDGSVPVRVVRYEEKSRPTMILVNGEADALAHGRVWIEAETGRVHKTELVVGNADSDIRVVTWYRPDQRLSMWVPSRMTENYDYTQRLSDVIECEATYANFRRFETGGRLVIPK